MSISILLYETKASKNLFRESLGIALGKVSIFGVSDFKGHSDFWIGDILYNEGLNSIDLSNGILDDIIQRDRSLRAMDRERAERIATRLWSGFALLFEKHNFDLVVSTPIDRCSIDIIERIARANGIPFVSPLKSFTDGYCWFTTRGERIQVRDCVPEEEVARVYSMLSNQSYVPSREQASEKHIRRQIKVRYFRRWLIENAYYPLCKLINQDSDNVYYEMTYLGGNGLKKLLTDDPDADFIHYKDLGQLGENVVYIPLHVTPEATVDYWCNAPLKTGYERYILDLIDDSDECIHFLIKEHPFMYRYEKRPSFFYNEIKKRKNVTLIHPLDPSNEILNSVENVVVSVGSVGIEAALRGKRVLSLEESYYSGLHPNIKRINRITKENLQEPILPYDNSSFVRNLLQGMYPSDYANEKNQNSYSRQQFAKGFELLFNAIRFSARAEAPRGNE